MRKKTKSPMTLKRRLPQSRNKKKNEFFWFFRPAPTQILQLSLREWKLVKNWSFSRFSTENQVLLSSHNLYHKKLVGLKKNSLKKLGPIRFYGHFSENFWEKKSKKKKFWSKKKIFESCYFIFKHGEKKKFFFWKIFSKDFST